MNIKGQRKEDNIAAQSTVGKPTNVKEGKTTPWWLLILGAAIVYAFIKISKVNNDEQPLLKSKTISTYPTSSGGDSTVTTYIYY